MRILGIHDGHNAAACLLEDGRIVVALQEERLSRAKNHDVFPKRAMEWALRETGGSLEDLFAVAMNGFHMPVHRDRRKLIEDVRWSGTMRPSRSVRRFARSVPPVKKAWEYRRFWSRAQEFMQAVGDCYFDYFGYLKSGQYEYRYIIRDQERARKPHQAFTFVEHHECHALAAYWGSSFRGEPVLVLTCDGAGDDLCATVNVADEHGKLTRIAAVNESHSPALIYLVTTTLLGMVPNEHEYKLMGMAPYADADRAAEAAAVFEGMLEWDPNDALRWRRREGVPSAYYCYDYLKKRLDLMRFDSICGGVQLFVERLLTEWVRRAVKQTGIRKLALSGGIFMNVKANQAIAELPEVEDLFVFPSCGDETNAMGAAYGVYASTRTAEYPPIEPIGPIYWGPDTVESEIEAALAAAGDAFIAEKPNDIAITAAEALAQGEVVARFAGRAEFGARALGNRSILANPAAPGVVRTINSMIKSRDFWMPFACSMLDRRANDYLINPKGLRAPYMILTFNTTARSHEIEAGVHPHDRTCRPQIVERDWNPEYYRLLEAFEAKTGIGALLNTSFNLHGYPIVNSPAEALDVMKKSGLNCLILGQWWVRKREA